MIEEEAGRGVARALGLHISGVAGQLLKAMRENAIADEEAAAKLVELRQAGRINRQIFEAVGAAIKNQA